MLKAMAMAFVASLVHLVNTGLGFHQGMKQRLQKRLQSWLWVAHEQA